MIEYKILQEHEINCQLFHAFIRHQIVDQCLRYENGTWVVRSAPFIDDWSEEEYEILVDCLRNTIRTGGFVCGAFFNDELKGFVSVENGLFGKKDQYYDLSSIHVSAEWARKQGAKKLYISAHSAIESQAFYHSMGCVDAVECTQKHIEAEPYDRQLEYIL